MELRLCHQKIFKGQKTCGQMFNKHSVSCTFAPTTAAHDDAFSSGVSHPCENVCASTRTTSQDGLHLLLSNARCIFNVLGGGTVHCRHHQRPAASEWGGGVSEEQLQQAWDASGTDGRPWCVARSSALDFTGSDQPTAVWAIFISTPMRNRWLLLRSHYTARHLLLPLLLGGTKVKVRAKRVMKGSLKKK